MPSSFGSQSIDPVNTSELGISACPEGLKKVRVHAGLYHRQFPWIQEFGKSFQVVLRNSKYMVCFLQISLFRLRHSLPFQPRNSFPQWIPGDLKVALPNSGFYVVREKHFGAGPIPRNRSGGGEKIAQNDIVCLLPQQFS